MTNKFPPKIQPLGEGIFLIETYYLDMEGYACCYLIKEKDEAMIIETNTNHAVPHILAAVENLNIAPDKVRYVIVTHIHLDHAGGTGLLMRHLPQAKVIAHSRAQRHLANPEKLIESVMQIYGENRYRQLYGDILPIDAGKIIILNDEEGLFLGQRRLSFYDAPGHARHHFVILDETSRSLFSGDSFGISYPRFSSGPDRFIFPSATPTQFDGPKMLETIQKIVALNPTQILLTHFGAITKINQAHQQLKDWINFMMDRAQHHFNQGHREDSLVDRLTADIWQQYDERLFQFRGNRLSEQEKEYLKIDAKLNAQGVAQYIQEQSL